MPVTEVSTPTNGRELASYELAYHVLPTVAEGEVAGVSDELKKMITRAGGDSFGEEAAERFELAYEIDKYLEGKYRKFTSAYFGWIRFHLEPAALTELTAEIGEHKQLLRYLMIRLTKVEEMNPFHFHEALLDTKVRVIDTDELVEEVVDENVPNEEIAVTVADVDVTTTEEANA